MNSSFFHSLIISNIIDNWKPNKRFDAIVNKLQNQNKSYYVYLQFLPTLTTYENLLREIELKHYDNLLFYVLDLIYWFRYLSIKEILLVVYNN